ncbi:FAD binding domain-containing protein [Aspergillus pseudoustus]|uniref:FAD binding domain-containing protein n=1 Tax=Aspergillus pseudoustus TaxID=1810923 RepID=A0ABR4KIG1_9EURO
MAMATRLPSHLPYLRAVVSGDCEILHDAQATSFRTYLARWSDIDLQTPGAIVLPRSEEDCVKIVQWATRLSIPFVPRSGGRSRWSTIGREGIILDLSHYAGVRVDAERQTATLIGGVRTKEVGRRLAESGLFTALGNGNSVGAIPYFLNGGNSITSALIGYGADQILSARIVTAAGELIEVSEENHPDLLFALRGAGQFFGLVTQLTIRAHPLSLLRKQQGLVWIGGFVFPLTRAAEVVTVAKQIADDPEHLTVGLAMIIKPPPNRIPSIIISVRYLGDEDPELVFKALHELEPVAKMGSDVPIQDAGDINDALGAEGGFKRLGQVGLRDFNTEGFMQSIRIWEKLVDECPDAINSSFNLMWSSRPVKPPAWDSAMAVHDIRFWQFNIIWHTDPQNREKVDAYNDECIAFVRGPDESQYIDFQNATRSGPIQYRYPGEARLAKLRELKEEWDPQGVFTGQLLD